jgi:hypothetical protein
LAGLTGIRLNHFRRRAERSQSIPMSLPALCFSRFAGQLARERRFDGQGLPAKIQSICNGKSTPITMQGLARAREKRPAQEQWETMRKTMGINGKTMRRTMRRTMETVKTRGRDGGRLRRRRDG